MVILKQNLLPISISLLNASYAQVLRNREKEEEKKKSEEKRKREAESKAKWEKEQLVKRQISENDPHRVRL